MESSTINAADAAFGAFDDAYSSGAVGWGMGGEEVTPTPTAAAVAAARSRSSTSISTGEQTLLFHHPRPRESGALSLLPPIVGKASAEGAPSAAKRDGAGVTLSVAEGRSNAAANTAGWRVSEGVPLPPTIAFGRAPPFPLTAAPNGGRLRPIVGSQHDYNRHARAQQHRQQRRRQEEEEARALALEQQWAYGGSEYGDADDDGGYAYGNSNGDVDSTYCLGRSSSRDASSGAAMIGGGYGGGLHVPTAAESSAARLQATLAREAAEEDERLARRVEEALRDPTGRLRLHVNNLLCTSLGQRISRLRTLRELYCHDNPRLRSLPPTLWHLGGALTCLHASRCRLESVPEELCQLRNLKRLSLAGNRLKTFVWDCGPWVMVKRSAYPLAPATGGGGVAVRSGESAAGGLLGWGEGEEAYSQRPNINPFSAATTLSTAFERHLEAERAARRGGGGGGGGSGGHDARSSGEGAGASAQLPPSHRGGIASATPQHHYASSQPPNNKVGTASALMESAMAPWAIGVRDVPPRSTATTDGSTYLLDVSREGDKDREREKGNARRARGAQEMSSSGQQQRRGEDMSSFLLGANDGDDTATESRSHSQSRSRGVEGGLGSLGRSNGEEDDTMFGSTANPFSWIPAEKPTTAAGGAYGTAGGNARRKDGGGFGGGRTAFAAGGGGAPSSPLRTADTAAAKSRELARVVGKVNGIARRIPAAHVAYTTNEHTREGEMGDFLHKTIPKEQITEVEMVTPSKAPYVYQHEAAARAAAAEARAMSEEGGPADPLAATQMLGASQRLFSPRVHAGGGLTITRGGATVRATTLRRGGGGGALGPSAHRGAGGGGVGDGVASEAGNSPQRGGATPMHASNVLHNTSSASAATATATAKGGQTTMMGGNAAATTAAGSSSLNGDSGPHSFLSSAAEPSFDTSGLNIPLPPYCATADEAFTALEFLDLSGNEIVFLSPSALQLVRCLLRRDAWVRQHHCLATPIEPSCLLMPNTHLLTPSSFALGTIEAELGRPDSNDGDGSSLVASDHPTRAQSPSHGSPRMYPSPASSTALVTVGGPPMGGVGSVHWGGGASAGGRAASLRALLGAASGLGSRGSAASPPIIRLGGAGATSTTSMEELARLVFTPHERHNRLLRQFLPSRIDRCIMCGTETFVGGPTIYVHFVTVTVPTAAAAFALQAKETAGIGGIDPQSLRRRMEGRADETDSDADVDDGAKGSVTPQRQQQQVPQGARRRVSFAGHDSDEDAAAVSVSASPSAPAVRMAPVRVPCFYPCCAASGCHVALNAKLSRGVDPGHRALEV